MPSWLCALVDTSISIVHSGCRTDHLLHEYRATHTALAYNLFKRVLCAKMEPSQCVDQPSIATKMKMPCVQTLFLLALLAAPALANQPYWVKPAVRVNIACSLLRTPPHTEPRSRLEVLHDCKHHQRQWPRHRWQRLRCCQHQRGWQLRGCAGNPDRAVAVRVDSSTASRVPTPLSPTVPRRRALSARVTTGAAWTPVMTGAPPSLAGSSTRRPPPQPPPLPRRRAAPTATRCVYVAITRGLTRSYTLSPTAFFWPGRQSL